MHLENNVELVGFQKNPFPYIAACKVMVMPSQWEGFPMVAIESMALGKPLIATPVSGLRDIVTDNCGGWEKHPWRWQKKHLVVCMLRQEYMPIYVIWLGRRRGHIRIWKVILILLNKCIFDEC